jgi:hypothetical protein
MAAASLMSDVMDSFPSTRTSRGEFSSLSSSGMMMFGACTGSKKNTIEQIS